MTAPDQTTSGPATAGPLPRARAAGTSTAGGTAPVPLPDLPCRTCRRPRVLDPEATTVACAHASCSGVGIAVPLWWALDQVVDRNPAGLVRPVFDGLPVPWTTPVSALGAHWGLLHRGRLADCQEVFGCQICGERCDPENAIGVLADDGWFLLSAPLHPGACRQAATACRAVRRSRTVSFAAADVIRHGQIAPELGLTERWQLRPDHHE